MNLVELARELLPTSADEWRLLLTAVGLIGAFIAFLVGLSQYRRSQAWKRAEWVATEIDRFMSRTSVSNALKMIDWGARSLPLFPNAAIEDDRLVHVTDAQISQALLPHDDRTTRFSKEEAAIRDSFDDLLDGLERFEAFIEAGLVSVDDLAPYLDYWVERISLRHPDAASAPRLQRLQEYIQRYEFDGVVRLMERFDTAQARKKNRLSQ